jgi:hypothetical protein
MFKAIPGKSLGAIVENMHAAATLWKKHGGTPRMWTASVGEIGSFAFSAEFKTYADYGKCMDSLTADPDFKAWQVKNNDSGAGEWVRSNLLRELA